MLYVLKESHLRFHYLLLSIDNKIVIVNYDKNGRKKVSLQAN